MVFCRRRAIFIKRLCRFRNYQGSRSIPSARCGYVFFQSPSPANVFERDPKRSDSHFANVSKRCGAFRKYTEVCSDLVQDWCRSNNLLFRLLLNLTLPLTEKNVKQTESEDASNPRSVISQRLQLIEDLKRAKHAFADEKFFAVVKEKLSSLLGLVSLPSKASNESVECFPL